MDRNCGELLQSDMTNDTVKAKFHEDLENAPPVDWRAFRYRSLGDRFFENFFYLFRKLL